MNKKIVILVVVVECILAVLLISIIGKAIEKMNVPIEEQKVYFTDEKGQKYEDDTVIVVERMDQGYQLYWAFDPSKTSDKTVEFSTNKDSVTVNESGFVTWEKDEIVSVTIKTKKGKTATIILNVKPKDEGYVTLD